MHNAVLLAGAILASAASALIVASFYPGRNASVPTDASPSLEQRLADLARQSDEHTRAIADLRQRKEAPSPSERVAVPSVSDAQLAAALERYVEKHPDRASRALAGEVDDKVDPKSFDLQGTLAELRTATLSDEQRSALWIRAKKAGMAEKLLATFEAYTKEHPGVADAHAQLGTAYLEQCNLVQDDMAKGTWATKADKTFDKALELDPNHWGARFTKAVALSFWPPVFGKQPEAISHFETLIKQQEQSGVVKAEYVHAYVFLGNMYEMQGKSDQARDVFERGRNRFPDNSELKGKGTGK